MSLQNKKIILAITGSIAAYKTPHLVRLLVKCGAEVKVVMTEAAMQFVSPLALSTVSKNEVLTTVSDGKTWNNHVALGLWADLMLIAPCSANTLGKLSQGLCDALVNAVYLSARCPIWIAPAMDEDMWHHDSTQENINQLISYKNHIIPVAHGELASGLVGEGRMAEPEQIVALLSQHFEKMPLPLTGKNVLITAGPTYERLDPVRFIGNFSTGKMGIAIANSFAEQGANVTLVLGPTHLRPSNKNIKIINVESAQQMYEASWAAFSEANIAVLSAAVADFKPEKISTNKIKKQEETLTITLDKTVDILTALGKAKKPDQFLVGFALETENEVENAKAKLVRKNADLIVLNSLQDEGAGFAHDTNKITLITSTKITDLPLLSKNELGAILVNKITELIQSK